MTTKLDKKFFWLLLFLVGLAGCREEFNTVPLAPVASREAAEVTQTGAVPERAQLEIAVEQTESISVRTAELPAERPSIFPAVYHFLPASDRDSIFDVLLGPQQDAYFLQEHSGEVFVVFDEDGLPVQMAEVRRLGSEKGSILILLGMSMSQGEASVEKVYTFEQGTAASVKPYQAGKDNFLKQFQNRRVFDKSGKIQGITGATPVWKPVAEQIRDIRETLLKKRENAEWLALMKRKGNFWRRHEIILADLSNGDSGSVTQESPVLESGVPVVSDVQDVNLPNLAPAEETMQPAALEPYIELPAEDFFAESAPNTILYEHWKTVAIAEISLLACGLLIVITTQIKRAVYK